jgi:3-oxoacyl-[acyl-carrier protein] reductase
VVVNYSTSKEDADKVVAEIGKAIAVGGSVAKSEDIDRIFAETKKAYGRVDILVNNAGVYAFSPIETLTTESINALFSVNVFGLLLATKAVLSLFTEEGGSIINIGSVIGEMAPAQASIYAGTKGALNSITRVFAKELAPKKIRVNAVNPGAGHTEGFESAGFKDSPFEAHMVQTHHWVASACRRTSRTWLRILHRRTLVGLPAH